MSSTGSNMFSTARYPVALATALLLAGVADTNTCTVPSPAHPTIQSAVDAPSCSQVDVAAGTYAEAVVVDRSLVLTGAGSGSTFIEGGLEIQAGSVTAAGFHLSAPGEALWAHSTAEISGSDLEVVSGFVETPIFADGFEGGTTDAWDAAWP